LACLLIPAASTAAGQEPTPLARALGVAVNLRPNSRAIKALLPVKYSDKNEQLDEMVTTRQAIL